jgi:putative ABC transport system substrate-binding protein
MQRRDFIALLGAAATAPLLEQQPAFSQQPLPVVGVLNAQNADSYAHLAAAIRKGLQEGGFIEGRNVSFEFRWADGRDEHLPVLAAELVARRVAVLIASGGLRAAQTAKAATSAIPVVFTTGSDPVKYGLVASFNRPGGNITGVNFLVNQLNAKRLELITQLVPGKTTIGLLARPSNAPYEADKKETLAAGTKLGLKIVELNAETEAEFEAAFATAKRQNLGALMVQTDPFFNSKRETLVGLAARYAIPTIYELHEFVQAGGLMSYGTNIAKAYRQAGIYAGRILKGEKPSDLPVIQSERFQLSINLKSAKALGLAIPQSILVAAEEVIE